VPRTTIVEIAPEEQARMGAELRPAVGQHRRSSDSIRLLLSAHVLEYETDRPHFVT